MTCQACNTPADPLSNCPRCGEFVPVTVTPKQATIPDLQPPLAAEIDSLRAQLQVARAQTSSDRELIAFLRSALLAAENDIVQSRDMGTTGTVWSDGNGSALSSIRRALGKVSP